MISARTFVVGQGAAGFFCPPLTYSSLLLWRKYLPSHELRESVVTFQYEDSLTAHLICKSYLGVRQKKQESEFVEKDE